MKKSLFIETDNDPAFTTPIRGINTTVKNSLIFNSTIKSSAFIPSPSSHNQLLKRQFLSKIHNLPENPTTYDNSLAKPHKTNKSMIKLNLLHSSGKSNPHSHSQSKRKKFISVTQRGQQHIASNSQKKNHFIIDRLSALEQKPKSTNKVSPFSTFQQLLTPGNTLKQYWSTMMQTLSNAGSKVESRQQVEENIMNEDVLPHTRDFSVAQKARMERKAMMNSLIFSETQRKNNARVYTQMEQHPPIKREHALITQPECPLDSRNFAVFQERIGQNTLTRKDSLILALMDELENQPDQINQSQQQRSEQKCIQQVIPCVNEKELDSTKRYQDLVGRQPEEEQQAQQSGTKKRGLAKANKIKCISLIEKQQSYKYKNSQNQPGLEGRFMEMKKKVSTKT